MTTNVDELLKPRVKCIGNGEHHYPKSPYKIGEILTKNDNGAFENDNHYSFANDVANYPHLFRELKWYEDRLPEQMPEYVKYFNGNISKLTKDMIDAGAIVLEDYQPATEAEYNEYINQKSQK